MMRALLAAGGGFLMGVVWMDLLFDVQALGASPGSAAIASIAAYYRRATTEAFPMNRLIAAVMLATLAGTLALVVRGTVGRRRAALALAFAAAPIGLALVRVFPNAVRLGAAADAPEVQAALARSICIEHALCFAAMAVFVAIVATAREPRRSTD
ncbi:MAG TPA: hypothetical protein VFD92_10960 [Candidatus Binatia bacterium]|nr:hypothetical protein [Candidatus Binatia bacterium]